MENIFLQYQFKYSFRDYQVRALGEASRYLKQDGKIHIVAAPGAGKTVLALQLMIDLGLPALILTPAIALREQWIDRFRADFTRGEDVDDIIGIDLNEPKKITVITYQLLYSEYTAAVKKKTYSLVVDRLKESKVKVIILDEAHHLKSSWLDAVNDIIEKIGDATILSLTATPPYDMQQSVWKKYIGLCGDIDVEITVPELVEKNDLAMHQDYIFFNCPDDDYTEELDQFQYKINLFIDKMKSSEELITAISLHEGIININTRIDYFIEHFDYYLAMIRFLHSNHISIPQNSLTISESGIMDFQLTDLELLLDYCIKKDARSYTSFSAFFRKVRKELQTLGAITDNKVNLHDYAYIKSEAVQNLGKLNSIRDIIKEEKQSLGIKLKLVIITKNIYIHALDLWNEEESRLMGAIPIFTKLVNEKENEIIVLTGEIIIIPVRLKDELIKIAHSLGIESEHILIQELSFHFDYAKVSFSGKNSHKSVPVISCLFEQCDIHVLIGTSALIGEGWDAPFVNALIMATSVHSFVTSNQIRGRAIRTYKADPNKTANIWHLVCLEKLGEDSYSLGQDYKLLKHRFDAFEGVGLTDDLIDYGIDRLDIAEKIYSRIEIDRLNQNILDKAQNKNRMRESWTKALHHYSPVRIYKFKNDQKDDYEPLKTRKLGFMKAFCGFHKLFFASLPMIIKEKLSIKFLFGNSVLYFMGDALLKTLIYMDIMNANAGLLFINRYGKTGFYLKNSTIRENSIFKEAFTELLSDIKNPRYIIKINKNYFAVPELIGKNEKNVRYFFERMISRSHRKLSLRGKENIIYTRNPAGKIKLFLIKLEEKNMKAVWSNPKERQAADLAKTDIDIRVLKDELESKK